MRLSRLASLSVLCLAACSETAAPDGPSAGADCAGDGISVSDAWARAAQPGQPMSAAYLTLCNGGTADDMLVAASFDGASATEIHVTSVNEDGVASMAPADGVAIGAGDHAKLEPGGAHIMLIGLTDALAPGDAPVITLEFENAPPIDITLEVCDESTREHGGH
ncbi:MAG: copper chaperone PCu(A)C [Hyphococcus sp.]